MIQLGTWHDVPWPLVVPGVLVLGWVAQRLSRWGAEAIGLLDQPNPRKIHAKPIPLSGGPGILLPLAVLYTIWMIAGAPGLGMIPGLVVGLTFGLVFLVGMFDDLYTVSAKKRLAMQALVGFSLWAVGFRIDLIQLGAFSLDFGYLSLPITMFWFMGFMNTSNIMDGMDGLAGGMCLIAISALACSFLIIGAPVVSLMLILALLILVFLSFNLGTERKIFLGDSGSLTLGLGVAVLALLPRVTPAAGGAAALHWLPLTMVLGAYSVGIADLGSAIIRRYRKGCSPFAPDNSHFHHILLGTGLSRNWTLAALHGTAAIAVYCALFLYYIPPVAVLHFLILLSIVLAAGIKLRTVKAARKAAIIQLGEVPKPQVARTAVGQSSGLHPLAPSAHIRPQKSEERKLTVSSGSK